MYIMSVIFSLFIACSSIGKTPEGDSSALDITKSYPRDDQLRVSDGQILGTHNSYHVESEGNPIPEQLISRFLQGECVSVLGT